MLTPLTTVHTLAIHSGFNDENVKEWIDEAFYLRGFNYLEHDPVLELRDAETINNPEIQDSLSAYLAHVKIHLGLDILSSTLKNALPDTSNDTIKYDLELMTAYTTALFEQSSSTPLKTLLYNAIKDTSEYLHIEEKENFKYIFAKVTEAAADANYELSERLDLIVSQGIEENRSPTELIATIDILKEYVATEYREKVANLSHDLHLISDLNTDGENDLLRATIDQRLEDLHGDFVPRIEQALDKFGKPTTDAKKALKGVQLPIAGFRGSGLAWMVDILSGVLTGGNHAGRVKDPFDDFTGPQNIGHLFITFKANLFQKNYNQRIKDNIKTIKKLPKIKGIKEIMYPGQNKFNRYRNNFNKKISISDLIKKDLENLKNF